ncbi:S66 family peptidase [Streptosporangium roseum]|uniref:S66 family peptidase n=1 Tax=Streptosporangium roseum TaxID=2001 RepID=UPI0001A3ED17|nr:S66 peptidase family protein [Streptosporangium roseum]
MAIVSPSGGAAGAYPRRFDRALAALREAGLVGKPMRNARLNRSLTSATPQERVADLHEAFADPEVKGIICAVGGRLSSQLLGLLDYNLIAHNPKVFCGYSDATALHVAIHTICGLVTFYGPALMPDWGEWPTPRPETVTHFLRVVGRGVPSGPTPRFPVLVDEFVSWDSAEDRLRRVDPGPAQVALRQGHATGTLLVGCLPVLRELAGTPWQPRFAGRILVLETPQLPYNMEQATSDLWHLRNMGVFKEIEALAIGRPYSRDQAAALRAAVLEVVAPYSFPVLAELPCGHSSPILTLPLGIAATVSGDELVVRQNAVIGTERTASDVSTACHHAPGDSEEW